MSQMPTTVRGVPLVGPFPSGTKPVNGQGLYVLESPNIPGNPVFSYWNGSHWGLYASDPDRAYAKRGKRSCMHSPRWWGFARS